MPDANAETGATNDAWDPHMLLQLGRLFEATR